jgi:phage-related protein
VCGRKKPFVVLDAKLISESAAAAVIVLHVFQKKSKSGIETPKPDMDLIETRLKKAAELMKERKS